MRASASLHGMASRLVGTAPAGRVPSTDGRRELQHSEKLYLWPFRRKQVELLAGGVLLSRFGSMLSDPRPGYPNPARSKNLSADQRLFERPTRAADEMIIFLKKTD